MSSERQTLTHLMSLFKRHGHRPRTELGQNFLIDINIVEFVVKHGELTRDDVVLEVGSGTGGMTTFMAEEAGHVISVDVDRTMYKLASLATAHFDNVTMLHEDALRNKNALSDIVLAEIEKQLAVSPTRRLKLVANLPYSIATPLISNLVATDLPWIRMVVTIQYELGMRMQAFPKNKHYGSLSVWLQSQCEVQMIKQLGPTVFWPAPNVDSAIMVITPNPEKRARISDRVFFQDFIRRGFNFRRKFLRGVLCSMYGNELTKPEVDAVLADAGLPPNTRAEEMNVEMLIDLATRMQQAINSKI